MCCLGIANYIKLKQFFSLLVLIVIEPQPGVFGWILA